MIAQPRLLDRWVLPCEPGPGRSAAYGDHPDYAGEIFRAELLSLRRTSRLIGVDAVVSLLDRQVAALAAQESAAEFLVSVAPFPRSAALPGEPRIAVHLDDLADEAIDRVRVLEGVDQELVSELDELRRQLVKLWPDRDDSGTPKVDPMQGDAGWLVSLARFDTIVAAEPEPLNYKADGARAEQLLWILDQKVFGLADDPRAACEAWTVALHNVKGRWDHAKHWLQLSMRVSAGLALIRLGAVPGTLTPSR